MEKRKFPIEKFQFGWKTVWSLYLLLIKVLTRTVNNLTPINESFIQCKWMRHLITVVGVREAVLHRFLSELFFPPT